MPALHDSSVLVALFRHNLWANLRLLDACAALTDAQLGADAVGTRGSIADTLRHVIGNEEHYLGQITGRYPDPPLPREGFAGFAALREHARASGEGLIAVAATAQATDVVQTEWQGRTENVQVGIILIQAINHATEHRTQIKTILTQIGVTPPEIDCWTYGAAADDE
jgi:uncharacterized damage-inducible protein DinB